MSTGSPGPYMNDDGDIWVPRTVPWKDARGVAQRAVQEFGDVIRYVGKEDALLYGFTRDCFCEDACHLRNEDRDDYDPARQDDCLVPAWHFRQGEPVRPPVLRRTPAVALASTDGPLGAEQAAGTDASPGLWP